MNKLATIGVVLAVVLGMIGTASAVPVTFTYTADNVVEILRYSPSGPWTPVSITGATLGSNTGNWTIADSLTLDLAPGNYTVLFNAFQSGNPSSTNPAGLLAQIDTGSDLFVSSNAWEVQSFPWVSSAAYVAATEYGNNGGPNIWTNNLGGPVADISTSAQWIWTENNFGAPTDDGIWARTRFAVANPVPEPGTIFLLGTGLVGLAGYGRKRRMS